MSEQLADSWRESTLAMGWWGWVTETQFYAQKLPFHVVVQKHLASSTEVWVVFPTQCYSAWLLWSVYSCLRTYSSLRALPGIRVLGLGGLHSWLPPSPSPGDAQGAGTCCKAVSDACQHLARHVSPELLTWKAFGVALWQAKWTGRCGETNNAVKLCSPGLAGLTDALEAGSVGVWSWSWAARGGSTAQLSAKQLR